MAVVFATLNLLSQHEYDNDETEDVLGYVERALDSKLRMEEFLIFLVD